MAGTAASATATKFNWGRLASTLSLVPVAIAMNDLVGSVSVVEDRGMEPTLMRDDVVLVAKWPIKVWRDYHKGDVVLLKSPQGDHTSTTVVKRLTGTEREWRTRRVGFRAEPIPEGFCWVSGDNPLFSEDSQLWGPLPLGLIEGKVPYIIWPLNRMGPVSSQQRSPASSSSSSSQQRVTVRKGVVMIQKEEEEVD